ncbi:anti-sigma factor antagonist [Conexibacter sp. W3-3-2]|uniref:STAS domain-containing protein n=1 Tax=Conexibacter sp. W3-3-2 TaxID=2675227 RepID=UPI0012B8FEAA|nr:STAS domain-containing protein [Conexibacter sp. W3-3-2]MTD46358.1 anti-sigma factor antagonist [Conexibacter sp. W3-3-2]
MERVVGPQVWFSVTAAAPREGEVELRLAGDLDLATTARLRAAVDEAIGDGGRGIALVLELSDLRFVDSTGIRVILDLRTERLADGGRLILRAPTPAVLRVLELMALDTVLEIERGSAPATD